MKARAAAAEVKVSGDHRHGTIETEPIRPRIQEIQQRAYELHVERGGVHGRDQDDWFEAERELAQKYSEN